MSAGSSSAGPVLVVDNHDSFVHTLVGYLHELGAATVMVEADQISADAVARLVRDHTGILISPGPGRPADTAASQHLVREALEQGVPVLGVCLGHQVIAEALGARVTVAPELFHGVTSPVTHDASSESRNSRAPTMSSTEPIRLMARLLRTMSFAASPAWVRVASVSVGPGAIALTRIRSEEHTSELQSH